MALVIALPFWACSKEAKEEQAAVEPTPAPQPQIESATIGAAPPIDPQAALEPQPTEPQAALKAELPPLEPPKRAEPTVERSLQSGEWTVQIGAFAQKQTASNLVETLRRKGYEAYVGEAAVGGRTLHRVFVGRLANRLEAQALEKTVETKEGFKDAFVVSQAATKAAR